MGFFDGGGKAVKFDVVNQGVSGVIVGQHDAVKGQMAPYIEVQQTDYTTKELATYKDGNPIMQAIVLLQTEERVDSDDDGQRTLYVNKTRMKRAIQKALQEGGAGDLEIGGVLTIWMTGTEPSKGGGSAAKTFAAQYQRAVGGLAPAAPAPVATPAPAVAAPPAPVAAPPAAVAPPAPVAAPPAPVAAPPVPAAAPVAAPPAPVAAPPAPVAAPPAPVAAPPAPVAAPPAPVAPAAPPAPVAAAVAPAAAAPASDLPF